MTAAPTPGRVLQRVILPLYVELGAAPNISSDDSVALSERPREQHAENVLDRHSLLVPAGVRASFSGRR